MKPLVSIITPTFNHGKYISACINSVLNQTYKKWEMIIIDDASYDTTFSLVSRFAKKDKRIKFVRHRKNWGIKRLKDSYNQALSLASGDLIAILEGDDYWPKDKLEKQTKDFIKKNVVLSYGDWVMTDVLGHGIKLGVYGQHPGVTTNLFVSLKFYLFSPTIMIRKKALEKIGGFQSDKDYPFTDIPTYLALSLKGEFYYHPEILGFYRKQPFSSWFSFAKETEDMGREKVKKCVNNFLKIHKIPIQWKKIEKEQQRYINFKRRHRTLSCFYHSLAFSSKPFLKYFVYFVFRLKYFVYQCQHRSSSSAS